MERKFRFLSDQDKEKINLAVQLHTPLEIVSYTLPRQKETYIQEVLTYFLERSHQEHMIDNLIFCLGELLTNAKKANTKRVYFNEKKLDINDEMDYHEGMVTFKEDMLSDLEHYLELQKEAGLYIKLILQLYDEGVKIEIRNNSIITVFEEKRIREKLKVARKYEDPKQVISRVIDQTEGAGLGIIIIVLMLRKIGLPRDSYKFFSTDKETITQMLLPLNDQINKDMDKLYGTFIDQIETIPVFEESIKGFAELAADKKSDDNALMEYISKDISLASLLLKKVDFDGHKCSKLTDAYALLGCKAVEALITPENKDIRLIKKQDDVRGFWQHEYDVAFYAYNIAKNHPELALDLEEVYLCGLFHDIECLLLEVATEEQKAPVKDLAASIDPDGRLYELFEKDFGHSRGCYMLAQKWAFPENIAQGIRFHNNPEYAPEEIKSLVYTVYLADILQYYKDGKAEFFQINQKVLEFFGIDSKEKLDFIVEKIGSQLAG